MNRQTFLHYLYSLSQTLLRFAGYGAGFAAGAGMVIIAITTRIGENNPVNNQRFIEVVVNYAIVGALLGAIVGLIYWFWAQRR
jgi:hypothetical protein